MQIELPGGFFLDHIRDGDQPAYIEHFSEKYLTDCMMLIPFPYTQSDADEWVSLNLNAERDSTGRTEFVVRRTDGFLVGGVGLTLSPKPAQHLAQLGYWIGRDFRGRGLGLASIQAITSYGFQELGLRRIEAWVFESNAPSQRTVERAGFIREGLVNGHHQKHGKLLKSYLYALLHPRDREAGLGGDLPRQVPGDDL